MLFICITASPEIGLFIEGSRQMWVNRKGAFFINNQTSVSGSIRVLDGYPPGPDDLFNAGFAYGDDGDTGFFLRDGLNVPLLDALSARPRLCLCPLGFMT